FQDMGQRLEQIHQPQERRLQRVEQRLEGLQQPDRKRLQSIENRLVQITARMDGWAAVVADLSNDDQSVTAVNAATVAEPPATRPIEPVLVAHNDTVLQQPPAVAESAQGQPLLAAAALSAHGGQGDWVINIGSYLGERIAAGKLAEFRQQGVTAELETATVRGKTIYRIQVPGFASRAEARDHARQVQATLGLEETWIRRR
ncbi:MAG: SPOR domain-containing protein, partial [Gammaproteobacteria bacterium]|nr:SPOR domain-containing protein [Gammaproteobacteria bacterium]